MALYQLYVEIFDFERYLNTTKGDPRKYLDLYL